MEYIDVKTASVRWSISERRITTLCRNGRIEGAKKENGIWLIPSVAMKPSDGRKNRHIMDVDRSETLPLPIGVSDFKEMVTNYYYVDKTLLIKELIDARPKVSLFTRPRRFGKTLTMDMLKTYFEKMDMDTSVYFKNLNIWNCGEKYRNHQGKYPVIFLTFKDVKFQTWDETMENIRYILRNEFDHHLELLESDKISEYDKNYFRSVLSGNVTKVELTGVLAQLSKMLYQHYEKKVVIIIDEYDTPIQQGYMADYYEDIVGFMRNLFSGAFKDNSNLAFGFLTGILRVAKESIFSGMNNLKVNSILEERYSEYFGFTSEEIYAMTKYYDKTDKYEEICDWYDGYRFGNTDIFNPWSVLNYFDDGCFPKAFWQSTGDNSIIRKIVSEADRETSENLQDLMRGKTISSYVDTSVIYPEIQNNPSTIYSFLLAAGYLKIVQKDNCHDGNAICRVAIPNKEIFCVYEKEILSALSDVISQSSAIAIQHAVMEQNIPELQKQLQNFLVQTISFFDYAHENFYHGLMLGLCAIMNHLYAVDSNRESGYGRYDIQLNPYNKKLPGVIMELKVVKETTDEVDISEELEKSSSDALKQIEEKDYVAMMKRDGVTRFMKMGVAFYKKQIKVAYRMDEYERK